MKQEKTLVFIMGFLFSVFSFANDQKKGMPKDMPIFRANLEFLEAAEKGHTENLKDAFSLGAELNTHNIGSKRTALILSAINGHESCLNFLLAQKGIDLEAKDYWGRSALLWACAKGSLSCVVSLLTAGANFYTKDQDKDDALTLARKLDTRDAKNIVEILKGVMKEDQERE